MGLGMMLELPMLVVNVQRGGPSTGLPTKTEQADLLQAVTGRNGECPLPVIAAQSPADCFRVVIDAWRIATRFMLPVIVLTDGYIANGSEPWKVPSVESLPKLETRLRTDALGFAPYARDPKTLARPWAVPGTPGLEHRIGGLEKADVTGNVSYDPDNHEHMIRTRANKVAGIADELPLAQVDGPSAGDVLFVSWGGTLGSVRAAKEALHAKGLTSVAHLHLRYINPLQRNVGQILRSYKHVLVPELNNGQLIKVLRSEFLVDAKGINKIQGKPFKIAELVKVVEETLRRGSAGAESVRKVEQVQ